MSEPVQFLFAGEVRSVKPGNPTLTVLEWLRTDAARPGSKEGCAEGDCGACTVVVGELHGDGMRYRAVNSCIQFLSTLDGKQLITVEDLRPAPGELHPVQAAMVDTHASQCGYCTPGFVMSLFAEYHRPRESAPRREELNVALAGNLCRCTGYAPIVQAARECLPGQPDQFSRAEGRTIASLRALQRTTMADYGSGDRHCFQPRRLDELLKLLDRHANACIVAGGTDVGLWVTKALQDIETVIDITRVAELQTIDVGQDDIQIGAGVTLQDATGTLVRHFPGMRDLLERFGAMQVRNAGTIGGNIANGSPIGDMPPALIALGARLQLARLGETREIELEDFFLDYNHQDLHAGECVTGVRVPLPGPGLQFEAYKLSKRREQDISSVCGAFALNLDDETVRDIRIAFGGMAAIPKRAAACERKLTGRTWCEDSIEAAAQALSEDFTPITDMRASAHYRMLAAQNLLRRFYRRTLDRITGDLR